MESLRIRSGRHWPVTIIPQRLALVSETSRHGRLWFITSPRTWISRSPACRSQMVEYNTKRFLIVDDFTDFRSALTGMLRQMGVNDIDAVGRGEEALALCRRKQYDVILHDYNLGSGKNRSEERRVGKECRCRWAPAG